MATTWRPGVRATDSGTPPPLPVLPQFPGMRGYTQLRTAIRDLGFRHAAELLREPGRQRAASGVFGTLPKAETDDGFRVLDGLWFPGRGGFWQRVDVPFVQRARDAWQTSADPRALTAAAVTDTLETLARDDPMGLRRVVLWELCCLLKDGATKGSGPNGGRTEQGSSRKGGAKQGAATTADDVAALGVHRSEARLLAAAVDAVFPADGKPRRAAEEFNDVWPSLRLRRAEHVADLLPAAPDDHVLAARLGGLRARSAKVRFLAYAARRSQECGDPRAASAAWLRALRQATDAPELRAGLLRAATALADAPSTPAEAAVTVTKDDRRVGLTWRTAHAPRTHPAPVTYTVLLFPDGAPERATKVAEVTQVDPHAQELTVHHPDAPVGRALRYAVLPLRGDRVAGVPRVTAPVVIAPDVKDLTAAPVPGGIRLRWRPHRAAVEVEVRRHGPADTGPPHGPTVVPCAGDGAVDSAAAVGTYTYEVRCGYPAPGGRRAWSDGVRVTARVEEWPTPVEKLTAERVGEAGDRVLLRWKPARRGRSTLLPWPEGPVAAGTDVSERFARVATGLAAGGDAPDLRPEAPHPRWWDAPAQQLEVPPVPPAGRLRMTAVSVLGDRAVAGASVVVEHPDAVRDLTVRRVSADRARVRFSWPEPAVLVLVSWHDATRGVAHRVARSRHRAEGGAVELAVPETACTVSVTPLPRPDAVAVPTPPAHTELPALPPPPPPPPVAPPPPSWWDRWRRWLPRRPRATP
ncbi:hypothetical protein ABT039_34005 [Streptomyces lasiicapitis]|uniref:hypothetical protein n=1 Tax=Streptomyces lasiicapitis TaxID=1923961 RepID=UPI00332AB73D